MIRATIRDHKLHQTIFHYVKDQKTLSEDLQKHWKTWTLIDMKYLEKIEEEKPNERI